MAGFQQKVAEKKLLVLKSEARPRPSDFLKFFSRLKWNFGTKTETEEKKQQNINLTQKTLSSFTPQKILQSLKISEGDAEGKLHFHNIAKKVRLGWVCSLVQVKLS